jgi:hypothetical protein
MRVSKGGGETKLSFYLIPKRIPAQVIRSGSPRFQRRGKGISIGLKVTAYMERKESSRNDAGGANRGQKRNSPGAGATPSQGATRAEDSQAASAQAISSEKIAARAYEIYEREGRGDGRDMDHWLRAEQELRGERDNGEPVARNTEGSSTEGNPRNPQNAQNAPRSARRHQAGAAM